MSELEYEVKHLTRIYIRKGGKANRQQQQARMLAFAQHAARLGARSMGQVGRGQVIDYWKTNSHLADTTLYSHWLAIAELFELAGKKASPSKPFTQNQREANVPINRGFGAAAERLTKE